MQEFMSKDSFSVVISLLGVQLCSFPGLSYSQLLHPDTLHCDFHLTLTWSNYSPAAQSYTSLQLCKCVVQSGCCSCVFVHLLVYLPSLGELKLSGAMSPGGGHCWLRHQRGAMVAVAGGKETGAHFLWKWGYHFANYYCNYCRSLGRKPVGIQMGMFKIISYSSCHSHFTAQTAWVHQTIRS